MNESNIEKQFRDKFGTRQYGGQKDSDDERVSEDDFEEVKPAEKGLPK